MFAYLLIVAELSILYAVFWYVFIREPKPFEIRENIWGYYDHPVDVYTGDGVSNVNPFMTGETDEWLSSLPKRARKNRRLQRSSAVLLRSLRHGVKRKVDNPKDRELRSGLKKGWVSLDGEENPTSSEAKPSSTLGAVLAFVGDKLTQLSVKIS